MSAADDFREGFRDVLSGEKETWPSRLGTLLAFYIGHPVLIYLLINHLAPLLPRITLIQAFEIFLLFRLLFARGIFPSFGKLSGTTRK